MNSWWNSACGAAGGALPPAPAVPGFTGSTAGAKSPQGSSSAGGGGGADQAGACNPVPALLLLLLAPPPIGGICSIEGLSELAFGIASAAPTSATTM